MYKGSLSNMRYHVESADEDVMKIREDKEIHWDEFIHKVEDGHYYINRGETATILRELQEYLNCDFPYQRRNCDRDIINAFELVCRVAISLAEHPDPIQKDYITSKLYGALKFLAIEKYR